MQHQVRRIRSLAFVLPGLVTAITAPIAVSAQTEPSSWERRQIPHQQPVRPVHGWLNYGLSMGLTKLSGEAEKLPSASEHLDESGFGSSFSVGLLFEREGRPQVALAMEGFSLLERLPRVVWSDEAPGTDGFDAAVGEVTVAIYLSNQEAVTFSYGRDMAAGLARVTGVSPVLLGPDGLPLGVGEMFALGQRLESFRIGYQMADVPLSPRGQLQVDPNQPDVALGFRLDAGVGRLETLGLGDAPAVPSYRTHVQDEHWGMVFAIRAGGETPLNARLAMYGVLGGDLFLGSTGHGSVFAESGVVYRAGWMEMRAFLAGGAHLDSFYGNTADGTYAADLGAWHLRLGASAGVRF